MITREQYLEAKRIVDKYERDMYEEEMAAALFDLDDDFDEDDCDEEEDMEYERAEYASSCTCGAWAFGKDGRVYNVADCYCGAQ